MKKRLLDLFCCAGGATKGYQRAGYWVRGVDIEPQPRYCGDEFLQADAVEYLRALIDSGEIKEFDAIHASPPCQGYSTAWALHKREHPMLIDPVRDLLIEAGLPFILENVERAPMMSAPGLFGLHGVLLCGTAFGLKVEYRGEAYELRRHRKFESNIHLAMPACRHRLPVIGIYGHGESKAMRGKRGFQISTVDVRRAVMDMPWANRDEIAEAIPPAYTEFLGRQLFALNS
jgi:DNA (cytosine-5)-methyltransferase 1